MPVILVDGAAMDVIKNKPVPAAGATYRFYHRPEGWFAFMVIDGHKVESGYYRTEIECKAALNASLANKKFHKFINTF